MTLKNNIKILFTLFLQLFTFTIISGQPPNEATQNYELTSEVQDNKTLCYDVNVYSGDYFHIDCHPEETQGIDIVIDDKNCKGLPEDCQISVRLDLGGVFLGEFPLNSSQTFNYHVSSDVVSNIITNTVINSSSEDLQFCLNVTFVQKCEVLLWHTTTYQYYTECFRILSSGDEFTKRIRVVDDIDSDCFEGPGITTCCNHPFPVKFTFLVQVDEITSENVNPLIGPIEITGVLGPIEVGTSLDFQAFGDDIVVNSTTISTSISRSVELIPTPGVCLGLAGRLFMFHRYEATYYVNECGEVHEDQDARVYLGTDVFDYQLVPCVIDDIECGDNKRNSNIELVDTEISFLTDCLGSITPSFESGLELDDLVFEWNGPDGFTSNEVNLINIPYGIYNLTVYDLCCEILFSEDFEVCPDKRISGWRVSIPEPMTFCRNIHCGANDCMFIIETECVEPDNIISEVVDGECISSYYFEGELLFSYPTTVESSFNYNTETRKCDRIGICEGDLFAISSEDANYGPWEFNFTSEICERAIICFGEEVKEVKDLKFPNIVEEFDENFGLCTRMAYCDNSIYPLTPSIPDMVGPWNWDVFDGCTQEVTCDINSGATIVNGQESFENWTFNDLTSQCVSSVACNNETVFAATNSVFPLSIGAWSWNSSLPFGQQCVRSVLCSFTGDMITDYGTEFFQSSGVPCPGTSVSISYLYCNGESTGITNCFLGEEEVKSRKSSNGVRIYPNPTSEVLYIDGLVNPNTNSYELLSQDGKTISSGIILDSRIETYFIQSGLYVLKIFDDGKLISIQKFSKQ